MKSAGIYIHIPFCSIKCMYCDFYSITEKGDIIQKFIDAITKEIDRCTIDVSEWSLDTVFIGGGTPSILEVNEIEKILSSLYKNFDLSNLKEITLEANPGEAPIERLKSLNYLGINRLSIGVQSLQPELLKFLSRIHDSKQIYDTFDNARSAGFQNINCDLIYSIPDQTLEMWLNDLEAIINLEPEHISAYTLTVEKGTELFKMVANKNVHMPDDSQNSEWFIKTRDKLILNDYHPYEISNFSKPNLECRHNLHYWRIDPYLAFGPSAHGFDGYNRWNNVRNLNNYIEKLTSGEPPISKIERLTPLDKINEYIGFGLRMDKGITLDKIPQPFRMSFESNLLSIDKKYPNCFLKIGANIALSQTGLLFSDQIIPDLLL